MDYINLIYGICLFVGIIYTAATFIMGGIADVAHHGDLGAGGQFSHEYGVGGDGHGAATGATGHGGELAFSPFSPLVISFFLFSFGGTGILLTTYVKQLPALISLPIAGLSGLLLAWVLFLFLNKTLGSLSSSSEVRINSLPGVEAEVTVAIPAMGIGEIAYVAMGSRYVAPARSDNQQPIPRYAPVRISRIVGNTFFVQLAGEAHANAGDTHPQPVEAAADADDR